MVTATTTSIISGAISRGGMKIILIGLPSIIRTGTKRVPGTTSITIGMIANGGFTIIQNGFTSTIRIGISEI